MSEAPISDDLRQAGRPTKFSDETVERLCGAVASGAPFKSACAVAGIGVTTLNEWRDKYPELEERLSDAREQARLKALQAIKAAGEKEWRAYAEWLRLSFPADYRGSANKIEVSASANAATVIITVAARITGATRQSAGIAPRPTGSMKLVSDDLPVLHWRHDA